MLATTCWDDPQVYAAYVAMGIDRFDERVLTILSETIGRRHLRRSWHRTPAGAVTESVRGCVHDFPVLLAQKLMFVQCASAFVVLPGGFGTLDELFEALTLVQTGKIHELPVVMIGTRHWSGLMAWIRERLQDQGFIAPDDIRLLRSQMTSTKPSS